MKNVDDSPMSKEQLKERVVKTFEIARQGVAGTLDRESNSRTAYSIKKIIYRDVLRAIQTNHIALGTTVAELAAIALELERLP